MKNISTLEGWYKNTCAADDGESAVQVNGIGMYSHQWAQLDTLGRAIGGGRSKAVRFLVELWANVDLNLAPDVATAAIERAGSRKYGNQTEQN